MALAPGRFDYAPISERPVIKWPGNARLAFWFAPNMERFEYLPENRPTQPDIPHYSRMDYGNRVGFCRMFDVLNRNKVRACCCLNLEVLDHFPEIKDAMVAANWDYMAHGLYNSRPIYDYTEEQEQAYWRDFITHLKEMTGKRLKGRLGGGAGYTVRTDDLMAEAGCLYHTSWIIDDQPWPINVRGGQKFIYVPYTGQTNDPRSGSWVIAVRAESADQHGMDTSLPVFSSHPAGEQPSVEEWSTTADTFAGRVRVEWDGDGLVTALGQLPFFIDYLKQAGLFAGWVADCPLTFSSPNAPSKRDLLGTVLLSVLSGHYRYAHITTLRCDTVNPRLLGMTKVVSEDAVRRGLAKIDEASGLAWLQTHLDYCVWPLLSEPWVLDIDSTVKPLYGRQEGAVVGYNPHKPGRPSHCYHTYLMANLRLVLGVDVQPGDEHTPKHGHAGLWSLLHRLGRSRWPALLRGDVAWGVEPVMARAEQDGLAYLFRLRMTANVKRALTKMMAEHDWTAAGHGWQGKETTLRLVGWSRQRRIVLLRRKLDRPLVILERTPPEQSRLSFAEVGPDREVWEYAALVTSLDSEILTLGQLYRDRGDCENAFDELKNQWGWGGFTTHDLKRCRLLAGSVALIFNWWSLFVRLADLDHRPEAITSRPLLMQAIARQTQHAGQVTLTLSSTHGDQHKARRAYLRIAGFLARLRETAEQLNPVQRWYRILSEALKRYLKGRQLDPPPRLAPA